MKKKPEILIVDDDKALLTQLELGLSKNFSITTAADAKTTIDLLSKKKYDLLLLDLHLPPRDATPDEGFKLLDKLKKIESDMLTIIITGNDDKGNAIKAIKKGAYDYFTKPFDFNELKIIIRRALAKLNLAIENKKLKFELQQSHGFKNIIGKSKKMLDVYNLIRSAAGSEANVLVTGESGTGKELAARAVHNTSKRKDFPFVVINCGALSENLLEDELFGHEKGAFTGAHSRREGRFEAANHGTIFLDEISSISLKLQAALLRVIQEKEFERIGSSRTIKVDVRIISATNRPLEELVKKEILREDFYYRINVFTVNLPALKEREKDILLLANYFINIYNKKNRKNVRTISKEALSILEKYNWPGNVRELENIIERAIILASDKEILPKDLPDFIHTRQANAARPEVRVPDKGRFKLNEYLSGIQKDILEQKLEKNKWNRKKTAEELGITYRQIKYLCEKYGF